jgi:hypothetical protein
MYYIYTALCFGIILSNAFAGPDLSNLKGWSVVSPTSASEAEIFAAKELQDFLKRSTNVDLPIIKESAAKDQTIFVGYNKLCNRSGISNEDYEDEDFRIVVDVNHIIIAGGRPRGTIYGVYTFLENYLGIRFLTADDTYVPKIGNSHRIDDIDYKYHPPFVYRNVYDGELIQYKDEKTNRFLTRLRINACVNGQLPEYLGGSVPYRLINHTFDGQLPINKYGTEHPEYYALIEGKRRNNTIETQPCLTNPEVLRIITGVVQEQIKEEPYIKNVSVSQNDNYFYCQCDKCAAIDRQQESSMGSLLQFVNKVADAVKQHHPGYMVGTLAYQYSRKPPKDIKPHDNVQIQVCSIECCSMHPISDLTCPKNLEFCHDLESWCDICDNVFIWNYNTNFQDYLLPCPNLRVIGPNIKYFKSKGVKGVFMQGAYSTLAGELSDLRNYVTARILWNPNQDTDELIEEFLNLHYGKAAAPIKGYITFLHDKACSSGKHTNCFGSAKDYAIDDEIIQYGKRAFDEALVLSENETIRERVEKASLCIYRAMLEPIWYIEPPTHLTSVQIEKLMPLFNKALEICNENGIDLDDYNQSYILFMLLVTRSEDLRCQAASKIAQTALKLQPVIDDFFALCSELDMQTIVAAEYLYQKYMENKQNTPIDMKRFHTVVKQFNNLCTKYNITMTNECISINSKRQQLNRVVGLACE